MRRYDKVTEGLLEEGEKHMHVDWRPASQMPPVDTVLTSPLEAVHLRVMLNPASIGHFLRDNLLPLVSVPQSFGEDARAFVWLQVRCLPVGVAPGEMHVHSILSALEYRCRATSPSRC